jgi:exonuclease III
MHNYPKNFKIAHLNVNSIAGFKLHGIKYWLLKGNVDVLVLTETKLDATLPDTLSSLLMDIDSFDEIEQSMAEE